ncbi:TetR/AcrR family transcriptional regulator [Methylophilaceae bacterium]|nr:TetR/AcrR family transcriptional regulator [Methylophilaceae bacterium]
MKPKEKIILALKELIESSEMPSISTKNIARQANYSEAMIYQNFRSKHELMTSLLNHHKESIASIKDTIDKNSSLSSVKMKNFIKEIFRYAEKNYSFVYLVMFEPRDDSEKDYKISLDEFNLFMEEIFKNYLKGYELEPKTSRYPEDTLLNSIMSFIYGQFNLYRLDKKKIPSLRLDIRLDKLI